jgi:hypothetical protein
MIKAKYNQYALRTDYMTSSGRVLFSIPNRIKFTTICAKSVKLYIVLFAIVVYAFDRDFKEGDVKTILTNYETIFDMIVKSNCTQLETNLKRIEEYQRRNCS